LTVQTSASAGVEETRKFLLQGRNADGGWGYFAGKKSRLEPTCWAALALGGEATHANPHPLKQWPVRDGLLLEREGGDPNYAFHGLALITLLACGVEHDAGNAALLEGLQRVQGITLDNSPYFRQNNALVGWSWVEKTFAWVEPTSWCLFALKKWRGVSGARVDPHRVEQAEQLLTDRVCQPGGWNYGNSNALGQQLQPYVPTTAIGLMAMQDRTQDDVVRRGLAFLERDATAERSGSALALALLGLSVHARPTGAVRASLEQQTATTLALGNHSAIAMTLVALQADFHEATFRI
jgi:hypothetical protein